MIALPIIAQLAMRYVPDLLKIFVGDKTGQAAKEAVDVVRSFTGTNDPAEVEAALAADPDKALAMKAELAAIALRWEEARLRAVVDLAQADNADRAGARAAQEKAANAGSPLAWGAAVTSMTVLLAFVGSGYWLATQPVPEGSFQLVVGYFETIKTLATAAVFYWVGSSRGSAAKDESRSNSSGTAAVATTGNVTVKGGEATPDELMDAFNRRGPGK